MIRVLPIIALLFVASCGVDGEPVRPTADVAVGVGSSGVHAGARVGVESGPVRVSVGVF
ncbi:MAG: hypothetical protein AAFV87_05590 [Pseudomonadota bacterium]